MNDQYLLSTGEIDRQRLTILNKLYNPTALNFLKENGLTPGMTILEVGCGTGHMACELAKYVGPSGRVIAIDSSEDQIKIAKETARQHGIDNIEFHICNVFDLGSLGLNYDATYGRWVVEFSQQPEQALALMYQYLNTGGLLAYEATNMKQTAYFSYPYNPIIEEWHSIAPKMFEAYGYNLTFGYQAYHVFKELSCKNITTKINQAILRTCEEKSIYRLGLLTSKPVLVEKNIMSEHEIAVLSDKFVEFEKSNAISGFYHNILVSAIK